MPDPSGPELGALLEALTAEWSRRLPGEPECVAYDDDADTVIDYWGPVSSSVLVIVLHGGSFAEPYTRAFYEPLARALADRGARVANVEYRRAGALVGAPGTVADVRAAVDAAVVSTGPGDRRVVVIGHSAGGYLALSVADHPGVDAVFALSAMCDLERCVSEDREGNEVLAWVGSSPQEAPELWQSLRLDPAAWTAQVHLVHGFDDGVVPVAYSVDLADRAARAGARVDLEVLSDTGHYAFVDPEAAQTRALIERAVS